MVHVCKKVEIAGWYFLETNNEKERRDLVQHIYLVLGGEGIHSLAALTGYSFERLFEIGKLWELRKIKNRQKRGRIKTHEKELKEERRKMAYEIETREIAQRACGLKGEALKSRRNTLAKTTTRKAAKGGEDFCQ